MPIRARRAQPGKIPGAAGIIARMTDCSRKISVLFICTGNICRSPMAEAVFAHLVRDAGLEACIESASAATSTWEIGEPPHPGTRDMLRVNAIPLDPAKRARQVTPADAQHYDYLLVMDEENIRDMRALHRVERVQRLMDYAPHMAVRDVPDPYYTHDFGFTFQLVNAACRGLLAHIRAEHKI